MIAWIAACATSASIHDTEDAAERAADRMRRELEIEDAYQRRLGRISMVSTAAVHYAIEIEPAVRAGYWERTRENAA